MMKSKRILVMLLGLVFLPLAQAGIPMWTFKPLTPTQITINSSETKTVTYEVNNQSSHPQLLAILPIQGISQSGLCSLAAKGQAGSSCSLKLIIDGHAISPQGIQGEPALCQTNRDGSPNRNQCYRPTSANQLQISKENSSLAANLTISTTNLTLAQQGLFTEASGAGTEFDCTTAGGSWNSDGYCTSRPRSLTITNTGSTTALNVTYQSSPALPTGTTIAPATCGDLLPGSSCTLTITPGATPSAAVASAPLPSLISVSSDNTNTVAANIIILTYGHLYQGGYVFAINDAVGCSNGSCTASVNGTVLTAANQNTDIIWSSNGNGDSSSDVSYDEIPGISQNSTALSGVPTYLEFSSYYNTAYGEQAPFSSSDFAQCDGAVDGQCNSTNILMFYNTVTTNYNPIPSVPVQVPTSPSYYAAGNCSLPIDEYSDWYLPAICEMGVTADNGSDAGCGTPNTPTIQNIQSNLMPINDIGDDLNERMYWSSTMSSSTNGLLEAWRQGFVNNINSSGQVHTFKDSSYNIRCARMFQ